MEISTFVQWHKMKSMKSFIKDVYKRQGCRNDEPAAQNHADLRGIVLRNVLRIGGLYSVAGGGTSCKMCIRDRVQIFCNSSNALVGMDVAVINDTDYFHFILCNNKVSVFQDVYKRQRWNCCRTLCGTLPRRNSGHWTTPGLWTGGSWKIGRAHV